MNDLLEQYDPTHLDTAQCVTVIAAWVMQTILLAVWMVPNLVEDIRNLM